MEESEKILDAEEMSAIEARKQWICSYSEDGYYFSEYTGETPQEAIEECKRIRNMWGWSFDMNNVSTYRKGERNTIDFHKHFDPAEQLDCSKLLLTGGL